MAQWLNDPMVQSLVLTPDSGLLTPALGELETTATLRYYSSDTFASWALRTGWRLGSPEGEMERVPCLTSRKSYAQ